MKKLLVILLFGLLSMGAYGEDVNLRKYNIDIDSKSAKGWIRILNSDEKIIEYNIQINNRERLILIIYFKKIKSNRGREIR